MTKSIELPIFQIPTHQRDFLKYWKLPKTEVVLPGLQQEIEPPIHIWMGKFSLGETISLVSAGNDSSQILNGEIYAGVINKNELDGALADNSQPNLAIADLVTNPASGLKEAVALLQVMIGLPDTDTKYWIEEF